MCPPTAQSWRRAWMMLYTRTLNTDRGVTRLDGARGKKQVWRPVFKAEDFRKQMYCIEESTCDIVGTFRSPPQPFRASRNDLAPP